MEQAAEELGVLPSTWRSWESRVRAPKGDLERIAKEWGVKLDALTAGPGPKEEAAALLADAEALKTASDSLVTRVRRFLAKYR